MQHRTGLGIEAIVVEKPLDGSLELGRETFEGEVLVPRGTGKTNAPRVTRKLVFDANLVVKNDQSDGVALGGREVKKSITRDMVAKGTVDVSRPGDTLWRNLGEEYYDMQRHTNFYEMAIA